MPSTFQFAHPNVLLSTDVVTGGCNFGALSAKRCQLSGRKNCYDLSEFPFIVS